MLNGKIYAVRKGNVPGIYLEKDYCDLQVDGFSNSEFQVFDNILQAYQYMTENDPLTKSYSSCKLKMIVKKPKEVNSTENNNDSFLFHLHQHLN